VVFEVEIGPARDFEKAIRAEFVLVEDGKTTDKAIPKNILELALIYEPSESYIVVMPLFSNKGFLAPQGGYRRVALLAAERRPSAASCLGCRRSPTTRRSGRFRSERCLYPRR
jgi:hypothetical protein